MLTAGTGGGLAAWWTDGRVVVPVASQQTVSESMVLSQWDDHPRWRCTTGRVLRVGCLVSALAAACMTAIVFGSLMVCVPA
jgi:hypothetical protein